MGQRKGEGGGERDAGFEMQREMYLRMCFTCSDKFLVSKLNRKKFEVKNVMSWSLSQQIFENL